MWVVRWVNLLKYLDVVIMKGFYLWSLGQAMPGKPENQGKQLVY